MSLGHGLSESAKFWLFTVLVAALLGALLGYLLINPGISGPALISGSLILGGGISNVIDRVVHDGAVIDFMFLSIGGIRTGIFNLADVLITLGMLGLVIGYGRRSSG